MIWIYISCWLVDFLNDVADFISEAFTTIRDCINRKKKKEKNIKRDGKADRQKTKN